MNNDKDDLKPKKPRKLEGKEEKERICNDSHSTKSVDSTSTPCKEDDKPPKTEA